MSSMPSSHLSRKCLLSNPVVLWLRVAVDYGCAEDCYKQLPFLQLVSMCLE